MNYCHKEPPDVFWIFITPYVSRPKIDEIIPIETTHNNQANSNPQPSSLQENLNKELDNSQHITDNITVKDIGMISVFGVILPSVDQGSDYYTAAKLINYECKTLICVQNSDRKAEEELIMRRFGYAMLAPILLMTVFSLRQWWRMEKNRNRLWILPIVFLQLFPQYRSIRILCLGLRKKASWRNEKDLYDQDLTSLGMYILRFLNWFNIHSLTRRALSSSFLSQFFNLKSQFVIITHRLFWWKHRK